ncbi:unnamed protein product [Echinostoma caproni]|uniref:Integrase catalytic domain-containing protein n=1 Tax=Echinostoma caproni TaxID=27848 RepID=A0A183AGY4_9TREM|nr:unnamed protein product [Echinostoma caproni]
MTDNGSNFTGNKVTDWLNSMSYHHVLTPPRHPQSSGAAENFVRTLDSAITSAISNTDELDRSVDNVLMPYRNAVHSTTGHSPKIYSGVEYLEQIFHTWSLQKSCIIVITIYDPPGALYWTIWDKDCLKLDLDDDTVHRRHLDQVICNLPNPSITCEPTNAESIFNEINSNTNVESSTEVPRRSEPVLNKARRD